MTTFILYQQWGGGEEYLSWRFCIILIVIPEKENWHLIIKESTIQKVILCTDLDDFAKLIKGSFALGTVAMCQGLDCFVHSTARRGWSACDSAHSLQWEIRLL